MSNAYIIVSPSANTIFTGSVIGDALIYTQSNSQNILMGNANNSTAMMSITSNAVFVNASALSNVGNVSVAGNMTLLGTFNGNLSATNITSGTLGVSRGGTGTTSSTGTGSIVLHTAPTLSGTVTADLWKAATAFSAVWSTSATNNNNAQGYLQATNFTLLTGNTVNTISGVSTSSVFSGSNITFPIKGIWYVSAQMNLTNYNGSVATYSQNYYASFNGYNCMGNGGFGALSSNGNNIGGTVYTITYTGYFDVGHRIGIAAGGYDSGGIRNSQLYITLLQPLA